MPPVAGNYHIGQKRLSFTPWFPAELGVKYHAALDLAELGRLARDNTAPRLPIITADFLLPQPVLAARTQVTNIYPSSDKVPANLLKFYIHFSRPMKRGEAASHVALLGEDGRASKEVFLRLDEELWDPSGRRMTLFLDPGRIKRGLRPRHQLGGPLRAGRRYRLVIDSNWVDATGAPLRQGYQKRFLVTPDDREAPIIDQLRVTTPRPASLQPIELHSPDPLDHALAGHFVTIADQAGRPVAVFPEVTNAERTIVLRPARPWKRGLYTIRINAELEDLAGNSFRRLFDVDLSNPAQHPPQNLTSVSLPVRIGA